MASTLGAQAVGSIVKLKENGALVDYLVVHQGRPSSLYDASCDGTWLLRKDIAENRQWHSSNVNEYADSTIHDYLNSTFLARFDANVRNAIKSVKIPFATTSGTTDGGDTGGGARAGGGGGNGGTGSGFVVRSGANGLSCKIFLLSAREVGYTQSNANQYIVNDGAKLAYFQDGNGTSEKIANLNGSATHWWLRSPLASGSIGAWLVRANGGAYNLNCANSWSVRPALVLPFATKINSDSTLFFNTTPTISGSNSNLGTKTGAFNTSYTVTDPDAGQTLTVTEKIDNRAKRTFTATSGAGYSLNVTAAEWRELLNGSHTLTITASDGTASATRTYTFAKNETQISFTLAVPMRTDARVTKGIMNMARVIPAGATFKVEVCNNGLDATPAWEDVTGNITGGSKFFLQNTAKTAAGWAFNVRVTVIRGSGVGECYIQSMGGNFE